MIRFECGCGRRLKVDDSVAGRAVECPQCGARTRAPSPASEPLSGPEALVAAMRGLNDPADDIPVAEEVAPPPTDAAAHPLDALARAAAPAAGRASPAARRTSAGAGRRRPTRPTKAATKPGNRPALPNGRQPATRSDTKKVTVIAVVAAVAVLAIIAVVLSLMAAGGRPTRTAVSPAVPPPAPAPEPPKPRRFTGHQPGEMFRAVPFADEIEEEAGKDQTDGASK